MVESMGCGMPKIEIAGLSENLGWEKGFSNSIGDPQKGHAIPFSGHSLFSWRHVIEYRKRPPNLINDIWLTEIFKRIRKCERVLMNK